MSIPEDERRLVQLLADMSEEEGVALARKMLFEDQVSPLRALELCREAMDIMGKRFEAGLRERFKVMIGGGQADETVRAYTGADAFGVNAVEAVALGRKWLGVAQ